MTNETYKIGDTVYANLSGRTRIRAGVGKITKITPTGQMIVDFGDGEIVRFNKHGHVVGDRFDFRKLVDESEFVALRQRIADLRKRKAIAIARADLQKILIDPANKQELLEATDVLRILIEGL